MFSTMLQELKGYFGRDYLLGVFFPILIFVSLCIAIYLELTSGIAVAVSRWEALSLSTQVLLAVSGFVAIGVASYLIYNFQYLITRLFEGYWLRVPVLEWFREPRSNFHRRQLVYLSDLQQQAPTTLLANEISAEKLAFYPPPGHEQKVMPTRLGNILRACEIHAFDRYNIDSTIIWTRLRPLLPSEVVAGLDDKKTARDFSLLTALLAAVFTLIWCPVLAFFSDRWGLFLTCALGWPLALIAYRNAIQSTVAYAEQVKATFDVNRFLLLKALGRDVPKTIEAERKEWQRLSRFFYRNIPIPPGTPEPKESDSWDRVAVALTRYLERDCPPEN